MRPDRDPPVRPLPFPAAVVTHYTVRMRLLLSGALLAALAAAQDLPVTGIAHAAFLTSDISKARQFYTGLLGYEEAFQLTDHQGNLRYVFFKINEDQYLEIFPGLKPEQDRRMSHLALATPDIDKLHKLLEERGLAPGKVQQGRDGNLNFSVKDPDGMRLEFVQYQPGSGVRQQRGKLLGAGRISDRLRHVGITVANLDAAMAFYRDKLGFRETWRGGPSDSELRWVNMQMPGGDYLEFMLHRGAPTRSQLGSMLHICLEVPDIQAAYRKLLARGLPPEERFKPRLGRNQRWLLNLFDPDGSRAELMEPAPAK